MFYPKINVTFIKISALKVQKKAGWINKVAAATIQPVTITV
jgi:hypothetical protein